MTAMKGMESIYLDVKGGELVDQHGRVLRGVNGFTYTSTSRDPVISVSIDMIIKKREYHEEQSRPTGPKNIEGINKNDIFSGSKIAEVFRNLSGKDQE